MAVPEVLSFREFRAELAGVLDQVRRSPDAAVFVGAHRRAEADLVLFAEVAAGRLSTDELREQVLSRYRR
jgi:D-aminopeptidase